MDDARRAAEEARDLVVEDVVRRDRFPARVVLGQILAMQGEIDRALGLFEEHLEVSRRLGDPVGVVTALREIANVAIERLRPDEAIEPLAEASEVAASHEDARWILGLLASDRARVALQLGRVEEARAEYEASLASAQALGVLRGVAGCGIGLSHVGRMAGEAEAARPLLRDAARSAALTVLGAEATARGERQGRVASIEELAALV